MVQHSFSTCDNLAKSQFSVGLDTCGKHTHTEPPWRQRDAPAMRTNQGSLQQYRTQMQQRKNSNKRRQALVAWISPYLEMMLVCASEYPQLIFTPSNTSGSLHCSPDTAVTGRHQDCAALALTRTLLSLNRTLLSLNRILLLLTRILLILNRLLLLLNRILLYHWTRHCYHWTGYCYHWTGYCYH